MLAEILRKLFESEEEEVFRPPLVSRPSRKEMKKHLLSQFSESTQHRGNLVVGGREYGVIFIYIRSAIYTATYEMVGRRGNRRFPKLLDFYRGKPSFKELREYTRVAVKERKKRIERAQTTGH